MAPQLEQLLRASEVPWKDEIKQLKDVKRGQRGEEGRVGANLQINGDTEVAPLALHDAHEAG